MVIAALQLDGAKVGQGNGAVVGVGSHHVGGHPAVLIQPHDELDGGLAQPPGQLVENIHILGGGVGLFAAAGLHLRADILVHVLHGEVLLAVEEGQRLRALVGELLLHHEGGGHLVALIEVAVDDEAVQLGPQGDGLEKGRHDEMEHGVGEVRLRLILFGKVGVDGRQVDAL